MNSFVVVLISVLLLSGLFWGFFGVKFLKEKLTLLKLFKNGKYLVIFQNNAELRPTGGFIGSFALVDFSDYKIKKIDFNTNIYKLDKTYITDHIIPPPKPLENITNGKWSLKDSNYAISFPESAQKIMWFYKEETGSDIDGVFAVNASVVADLLKLTGPISMASYDTEIYSDNFFKELTTKIEQDYYLNPENKAENEPKTILKDLFPELFKKAKNLSKITLARLTLEELKTKNILIYSNNDNIESVLKSNNLAGEVKESNSDYLFINHTNVSDNSENKNIGGKSSIYIKESIDYQVTDNEKLTGNLTVKRKHNGSYDWPDGINRNWTRVLIPKQSELVAANIDGRNIRDEIEISEEAGKTSFGFWNEVAPGEEITIKLVYALPISSDNYSLLVQKQPGNLGDDLIVVKDEKILFNGLLDTDKLIK